MSPDLANGRDGALPRSAHCTGWLKLPQRPHTTRWQAGTSRVHVPTAVVRVVRGLAANTCADEFFPFLLCNVGTGVSILHVQSETSYTRVSGTALGGGTFLGLTRLLTAARHFQDAVDSASFGDARRVDMLVADIYGQDDDRTSLQLPRDLTVCMPGLGLPHDRCNSAELMPIRVTTGLPCV